MKVLLSVFIFWRKENNCFLIFFKLSNQKLNLISKISLWKQPCLLNVKKISFFQLYLYVIIIFSKSQVLFSIFSKSFKLCEKTTLHNVITRFAKSQLLFSKKSNKSILSNFFVESRLLYVRSIFCQIWRFFRCYKRWYISIENLKSILSKRKYFLKTVFYSKKEYTIKVYSFLKVLPQWLC